MRAGTCPPWSTGLLPGLEERNNPVAAAAVAGCWRRPTPGSGQPRRSTVKRACAGWGPTLDAAADGLQPHHRCPQWVQHKKLPQPPTHPHQPRGTGGRWGSTAAARAHRAGRLTLDKLLTRCPFVWCACCYSLFQPGRGGSGERGGRCVARGRRPGQARPPHRAHAGGETPLNRWIIYSCGAKGTRGIMLDFVRLVVLLITAKPAGGRGGRRGCWLVAERGTL